MLAARELGARRLRRRRRRAGQGVLSLAEIIARALATEGESRVEELLFATADPRRIAARVDGLCAAALGRRVQRGLFWRTSVGCVAGVELDGGERVVVKAHRAERRAYLEALGEVRAVLAADGGFGCPAPRGAPAIFDGTLFTVEEHRDEGEWRDAHDPAVRGVLAATLAAMAERLARFADRAALLHPWYEGELRDALWPTPHSPIFDFAATAAGAAWIDAIAARARARFADAPRAVGHFDWRVEHVRFAGGRVATTWDWDSLHAAREPFIAGAAAHAFTADWQRGDVVRVPSVDEMAAFIDEYAAARGLGAAPRAQAGVACVYACAYTARCNHAAAGPGDVGWNGDFRSVLGAVAERFLR